MYRGQATYLIVVRSYLSKEASIWEVLCVSRGIIRDYFCIKGETWRHLHFLLYVFACYYGVVSYKIAVTVWIVIVTVECCLIVVK